MVCYDSYRSELEVEELSDRTVQALVISTASLLPDRLD